MKRATDLASRLRAGVKALAVIAALAVALFIGQAAFSSLTDSYGFHPKRNALAWASLMPRYADSPVCEGCHGGEYASTSSGAHRSIACESCHGPQTAHATEDAPAADLANEELCIRCHEAVVGRPATFPQQDVAAHFYEWSCSQCHDPHSALAFGPPPVPHPLDKLPECRVCHGAEGMKTAPASHVFGSSDICLTCHRVPEGN